MVTSNLNRERNLASKWVWIASGNISELAQDISTLYNADFNQKYQTNFKDNTSMRGTQRRIYNALLRSHQQFDKDNARILKKSYQNWKPPSHTKYWSDITRIFIPQFKTEKIVGNNSQKAFCGEYMWVDKSPEQFLNNLPDFPLFMLLISQYFNSPLLDKNFSLQNGPEIAFDVFITSGKYFRTPFSSDDSLLIALIEGLVDSEAFYNDSSELKIIYVKPIVALVDSNQFMQEKGQREGIYVFYR